MKRWTCDSARWLCRSTPDQRRGRIRGVGQRHGSIPVQSSPSTKGWGVKIRRVVTVVAVVGASLASAAPSAVAAPGETARPGAAAKIAHVVSTPIRGGGTVGVPGHAGSAVVRKSNGIDYHGGPVMN